MCAGNLARVPILSAGGRAVPLLLADVMAAGVAVVWIVAAVQRKSCKLDGVALAGLAFAIVGMLSAVAGVSRFGLSTQELVVALAQLARWVVYFLIYIVAINGTTDRDVVPLWRTLETSLLLFSGFGILQSAFLPNFAQLVYPESQANVDWDVQGHRLVSTILDPNFAGAFIAMGLLVQLALMSTGSRVPRWKPVLLLVALLLTASRGSILAFIVGLGLILFVRGRSKKLLSVLGLVAVGVAVALPKLVAYAKSFNKLSLDDPSALARFLSWARGWTVFRDHPIIGVGFNTWSAIQVRYGWDKQAAGAVFGIDGGLLFVAVLTGAVGLTLYVAMILLAMARARSIWRDTEQPQFHRGMAIGIAAATLALVVHSLFTNSLLLPFLMEPLWVLWALGFVMSNARRMAPAA